MKSSPTVCLPLDLQCFPHSYITNKDQVMAQLQLLSSKPPLAT
jgi:hypothetical protein